MELLCLLIGLLIPVVALGLVVRRAVHPLAAATAYRNVAWRLGLDADTRGVSMQGWLDGRRLYVGEIPDPRRRVPRVRASLAFAAPLGLGLHAHRPTERLRKLRRREDGVRFGDPFLDERLVLRAAEPDRLAAVLDAPVREALRALAERWPDVVLDDHAVAVRLPRHPSNARVLSALVDALVRTAEAIEAAHGRLTDPPATLADRVAAWRGLADELALRFHPGPFAVDGERDGREVAVHPVRTEDGGFRADVRLVLRPHPAQGLRVSGTVSGPVPLDDPSFFDRAFVVHAWDPHRARRAFDEEARRLAVELLALGAVRIDDARLEVRDVAFDPEVVRAAVLGAEALAGRLGW